MGMGAMFGALNTMYSSVSARRIEIATLRAIGFGGAAVALSVLVESLLLAFVRTVCTGLVKYQRRYAAKSYLPTLDSEIMSPCGPNFPMRLLPESKPKF